MLKQTKVTMIQELPPQAHIPLTRWIWRSYFRTSLIPLLIVEVALISIYFISNSISNQENIETVRQMAENELTQVAQLEAASINHQLESITQATDFIRQQTAQIMSDKTQAKRDDPSRFAYSPEGTFYTTKDNGGSALFYSGVMPVNEKEREKAYRSAALDLPYMGMKQAFPLIVQLYYNTFDSMNRIYPYFDVITQYEPKIDVPSYNFYYEADLKHNPERKVIWTDVYVDPAGMGWMTSAIAPVYSGDFLEGVVGVDVTVSTIISGVLNLKVPWDGYGLLVSNAGTIIALPKAGEADWSLNELTDHQYDKTIQKDTFKPAEFNIFNNSNNPEFSKALKTQLSGMLNVELKGNRIVSWATIPETGWKLLITVPESKVYAPAKSLANRLNTLAWFMVGGMLVFYMLFFTILYRRAKQMSEFISRPLEHIDSMVKSIASGQHIQHAQEFPVSELNSTAHGIELMSVQLDATSKSRAFAEHALAEITHRLQSVFDFSPDGFISIDDNSTVSLVNPAFCRMTGFEANHWLGMSDALLWENLAHLTKTPNLNIEHKQNFRLELVKPEWRVLQCAVRSINHKDVTFASKVIYLYDMTREDELDRMKSTFLATTAHELRTPLTSVLGYSELLLDGTIPQGMHAETLQTIVSQSRWLVKIINELLELTRIEGRGIMDFTILSYPADALAMEAIKSFTVPLGRNAVIASTIVSTIENLLVDADAEKIKSVLLNVLDNAYKYSKQGNVSFQVINAIREEKLWVGFQIKDAGIGMSNSQLKQIYDRFWRADSNGTIPGTGLGMSISLEIMRLLGGEIEIESEIKNGTTVTLWLLETSPDNKIQ
ncbi:MAG: ATP-binding protein [Methylotenera sp.]|nr:ATP-binding protein [Methylotenera sp.]